MIVGIVKESFPGEHRVAMAPAVVPSLIKSGAQVLIEPGAGLQAGFRDGDYTEKGAKLAADRAEVFRSADVIAQVRSLGANPEHGKSDVESLREGQVVIGFSEPLTAGQEAQTLARRGVTLLSIELMPRITRAQSMDALSSMATIAGYKAVVLAAQALPRMFPMLMTAAGTVPAAKVFVIGAGVAGLQALATAKRLGAVTSGYDVRQAVKDQVESVGAKFVVLDLQTGAAEDKGGYAKAQSEDFYKRQQELMKAVVAQHDVVITTAAVPGKKSPVLVTTDMVRAMMPGSVIVDLASERGGNCELTRAGETVVEHGVTIIGPLNLPATVPNNASQMYAKNVATFLKHLMKDGAIKIDTSDEITRETLVTYKGEVVHPRVRELLGLAPAGVAA